MPFDWFQKFPALDHSVLRSLKHVIDGGYRHFSRVYGDDIEALFRPLLYLLVNTEKLLLATPWWLVIVLIAALARLASRSWKLVGGVIASFVCIGLFGMWDDAMATLSMMAICVLIVIMLGVPIGICMAWSNRMQSIIMPILDVMQTMPSFVYLIPVAMLLGIGRVPGAIAVIIYAIPPVIRLTSLGIRLVDPDVLEAAIAFGANRRQRLFDVQLPLAVPTIMAGINQTIMMAMAMVVVTSMVGSPGLGRPVLAAVNNQYFTSGLLNGLSVVALAIIFDRVSQGFSKRAQTHLDGRPL